MTKTLHLVLIGDTRSGKTSFANTISKNPQWGKVGENDGESTTIEVKVCLAEVDAGLSLNIFDTPGMNDTKLRLSNRQIKEKIEMSLLSSLSTHVDAFIITESLQAESVGIKRNAKNLASIFGPDAMKSTLVLLTKECYNNARSRGRQQACSDIACPFVFWKNNFKSEDEGSEDQWVNLSDDELTAQTQELLTTVDKLPNFSMANLENMKNEIVRRAKLLQEKEAPQYESVGVELDIPYLESKTVGVVKQRPVIREEERGGIPGFFGATKVTIEYQNYTEDQIVYEEKLRKETRQEQVELPKKSLEHYIDVVKKEIMKEFKDKLAK